MRESSLLQFTKKQDLSFVLLNMERLSIYEYKDYKRYLLDWMARTPGQGRGQRKLLADAVGCQTPFITHVLSGDYNFSPEQAEACSRFMGLNDADAEFFVLLVMKQRAGTKGLENLVSRQLSARRTNEVVLKKRLNIKEEMDLESQLTYYSSWHYSVIHMACQVPHLQNIEALKNHFGLTLNQIMDALEFLTEHKLIEKTKTGYKVLRPVLHLGKDSPLLAQHHSQWRLRAIDSYQKRNPGDLSYSGVASISREDYEWVRERFSRLLEEIVARVKDSKDEMLTGICFDLFQL